MTLSRSAGIQSDMDKVHKEIEICKNNKRVGEKRIVFLQLFYINDFLVSQILTSVLSGTTRTTNKVMSIHYNHIIKLEV